MADAVINEGSRRQRRKNWDRRTLPHLELETSPSHNMYRCLFPPTICSKAILFLFSIDEAAPPFSTAAVSDLLAISVLTRTVSRSLDPCVLALHLGTRTLAHTAPPERLPETRSKTPSAERHGTGGRKEVTTAKRVEKTKEDQNKRSAGPLTHSLTHSFTHKIFFAGFDFRSF